jgi:AcrR family transcriptional regulator
MARPAPGRQPLRQGAPHGRDAVRASLIESAAEQFADHGPTAVSVRQVADRAKVNHGLVHKYFGSKEGLLTAVLEELAEEAARHVEEFGGTENLETFYRPDGPVRRHARILAYLILEGRDPAELKTGFPALDALVERFKASGLRLSEARQRAVQLTALILGWQFFEPFLSAAAGLDSSGTQSRRMLEAAVEQLVRDPTGRDSS